MRTLVVLLVLLVCVPLVGAQEEAVPQPVIIQESVNALDWIINLLLVWVALSLPVTVTFERVKKEVLQRLLEVVGNGTDMKPVRTAIVVVGVFVASWLVMQEGGVNIFDGAPDWLQLNSDFENVFTTLFLATGAFVWHGIGDFFKTWKQDSLLNKRP